MRCLEVGAGGGSVATWLCEQVGPTGHVVATDINIGLLKNIQHPNLETRQHDVVAGPTFEDGLDFVHARWLLHHLEEPELAIHRMIDALHPAGWLLLEEPDFFPVLTSTSQLYSDFIIAFTDAVTRPSGGKNLWARALPGLVAGLGLRLVGGEGDFPVVQGGSSVAELYSLSAEQVREQMIGSGALSAERFDQAFELLRSQEFWALGGGCIAVWGQRPA
jgi:SAM-dependent methyltransferase